MSVSSLSKSQWFSVAKNAVIAGLASFVVVLQQANFSLNKTVVLAAVTAGVTAAIKFVEKAFTPVV